MNGFVTAKTALAKLQCSKNGKFMFMENLLQPIKYTIFAPILSAT